jgi:glycosyltransferase involved in cell wall biosynthesis
MLVSIVMPCLNEHETLAVCIHKARAALERFGIDGEIIVADNGSTDDSVEIARTLGACVVEEKKTGYGNAYRAGITAARGEYIVIGDSDDSYDFSDVGRFIEKLKEGFDLVMGTRLRGAIDKGAMPWMHRYIGNPLLTKILNIFFRSGISDAHCGMRGFTKSAYQKMELQTAGMEFASEMVIKAALIGLKITEIPITLHQDGRSGTPHLRSFRDGWRHLRFMLLHSPTHLYMWPGFAMFSSGMIVMLLLSIAPERIFGRMVDLHIMILGSLFAILGYQTILLGLYARIFAVTHNFIPQGKFLRQMFQVFNLERGLAAGAIVLLIGIAMGIYLLVHWLNNNFEKPDQVRLALFASTLIIIGSQTIFSSFFMSMLGIERK